MGTTIRKLITVGWEFRRGGEGESRRARISSLENGSVICNFRTKVTSKAFPLAVLSGVIKKEEARDTLLKLGYSSM